MLVHPVKLLGQLNVPGLILSIKVAVTDSPLVEQPSHNLADQVIMLGPQQGLLQIVRGDWVVLFQLEEMPEEVQKLGGRYEFPMSAQVLLI